MVRGARWRGELRLDDVGAGDFVGFGGENAFEIGPGGGEGFLGF